MKKSALIIVLFLGTCILRGDNCKVPGFSSSTGPTDSTHHKTQIIVGMNVNNSQTEQIAVTIDGAGVGSITGWDGKITKEVTSGKHTVAGASTVSNSNWPAYPVDVEDQQTFYFNFGCQPPVVVFTTDANCRNKGVTIIRLTAQTVGEGSQSISVNPGDGGTIEVSTSGPVHITAANDITGEVLYEATTPFLKCGTSYPVAVGCK
jgi:hypothetical protein